MSVHILRDIIRAWESLPEGRHNVETVQKWLIDEMKPAISRVREAIPRPQFDGAAFTFIHEAVMALREERDTYPKESYEYQRLAAVAFNLRDVYEWLYSHHWDNHFPKDEEFVPFNERNEGNRWGRERTKR